MVGAMIVGMSIVKIAWKSIYRRHLLIPIQMTPLLERTRLLTHAVSAASILQVRYKTMTLTTGTRVVFVVARCIPDVEHAAAVVRRSCARIAPITCLHLLARIAKPKPQARMK